MVKLCSNSCIYVVRDENNVGRYHVPLKYICMMKNWTITAMFARTMISFNDTNMRINFYFSYFFYFYNYVQVSGHLIEILLLLLLLRWRASWCSFSVSMLFQFAMLWWAIASFFYIVHYHCDHSFSFCCLFFFFFYYCFSYFLFFLAIIIIIITTDKFIMVVKTVFSLTIWFFLLSIYTFNDVTDIIVS